MTFLNPFALFGLAAAAIPIVLHLFNLRKLKTIEFSTLSFLKELQKTKIRKLKLRQLLLLILRTALIVLLVIAFSRPTLKGSIPGGLREQAKITAVILFDDSQSMTASDEQGELLQQAKTSALSVLDLLKDGDEVFLIKLSEIPSVGSKDIPSSQRNFNAIRTLIKESKPSSIHRCIEDAIHFISKVLSSSKNFNKEVYIISDFQSGTLNSQTNISKTAEQLFDSFTQFFLVPLGTRALQNVALESIQIPNTLFEVHKSFTVIVRIKNYGTSDVQNHVVSAFQNGTRVAQKGVDIRSGQSIETEFTLVPQQAGFLEGMIELEDDDLEFDNKRYFTVHIPEQYRVLLVGTSSDLSYVQMALQTRISDSTAGLTIRESSWNHFSSSQLMNIDVAILSNLPVLSFDQASCLKTFLQDGGGALIFPGDQTSSSDFNSTFAAKLGISTIAPGDIRQNQSKETNAFIGFDHVDYRHPIFAGMFEKENAAPHSSANLNTRVLESPTIKTSVHFLPTPRSQTIITLTNGNPFLIEEHIGDGRMLMINIAPTIGWSDLPLKGLFVPLMHRSVSYLAQEPQPERQIMAGDEKSFRLRSVTPASLSVLKPGGAEIHIDLQQQDTGNNLRFFDTDIPGIYTLTSGKQEYEKFPVNIDPDESTTMASDKKNIEKMLSRMNIHENAVHTIDQHKDMQRLITESRVGAELWKQVLMIALGIALTEMFVAHSSRRKASETLSQKQV